jgi:hypothetical protein
MTKLAGAALALLIALPCVAQMTIPDLRGTWKGESESIVYGGGNPHHRGAKQKEAELRSVPFTLVVDRQDGRRFSGTFSSPRGTDKVVAVITRNGTILVADDDGYTIGTVLAANRMEFCYLRSSPNARIASCTELTKQ